MAVKMKDELIFPDRLGSIIRLGFSKQGIVFKNYSKSLILQFLKFKVNKYLFCTTLSHIIQLFGLIPT